MSRPRFIPAVAHVFVFAGLTLGATNASAADAASTDTAVSSEPNKKSEPPSLKFKETVVGSRLAPAEAETAQDVHIYRLERIEQSGQSTVADFLATLPEVSLNSPENTTGFQTVRLRGAIFGAVLVLVNGHRTIPVTGGAAPFGFFDLRTIPLSLVERIEILPTGSSAIYGGDALGGVVNIVLRSNFTGAEVGGGYKWAKNTHEWLGWAGGGWKAGDLSLSIMGTYSESTALSGMARDITNNPDMRRFGGPNLGNQFFGAPANVSSVSGNLPGLNSSFAAVPVGSTGIGLTPADFAATAGTQNTGSFTRYQSLIPESRRSGIFASASYSFGPTLEVFAELLATKYTPHFASTPPFLQFASVPESNPFNPFGTMVNVSGVVQGAEGFPRLTLEDELVQPLVGARGSLGAWEWQTTALHSRDGGSQILTGQPNAALLSAALASSDPTRALNPFVDGPMASPSILASIYSNVLTTNYSADATVVDAFARGPLLQLPAGPLNALLGAEYEDDTFERGFKATRHAKAVFGELRVPLLTTGDRGEKREVLAVQGAARYDDYSDFGTKTTWQAGVEFRPDQSVLLRGTHATAFKPPTLYNLHAPLLSFPDVVNDPLRNGETVAVQAIQGGNPALQPITGTSSTLGFVWSPRQVRDLNVSMTGWWTRLENPINFPISSQFLVDNEDIFPGRVIRAPAPPGAVGQIVAVDLTYLNAGTMHESGIDGSVDWKFRTGIGEFAPAVAATYLTKYEGSTTAGSPSVDRRSKASQDGVFAPKWKGIASIGWTPDPAYKVWLAGRYIGRYTDYTPPRTIGNVWYVDGTLEVALEPAFRVVSGSLGGAKLLVSGTNLADKLPVYSTLFRGYDVFNYDVVGRTIFVRLKCQFGS
jgi:iron complex outermembrane receptor protein